MKAPTYRWICHKCSSSNEPHTTNCASCGFAAVASPQDIERSFSGYKPPHYDAESAEHAKSIWLFFPEGLFAALLVLVTPFWSIKLAISGHITAAAVLIAGIGLAVYAFVWLVHREQKYLAYFTMVAALALAFVIYSETR